MASTQPHNKRGQERLGKQFEALSLITTRRLMRAKTDAGTDVWMTEVADAAPASWVHCRCCVYQLLVMNTRWEFKNILIFRSPADELVWTSYIKSIKSFRGTVFKRSLVQGLKHDTAFLHRKRGSDETIFMDDQDDAHEHCAPFLLSETPLQSFATLKLLFCKQHLQLHQVTAAVLSSLSFYWWTNGSNSQHCYHTRAHMLTIQ